MGIQKIIEDTHYSIRTQISLSPSLYEDVKKIAEQEKKSMAEIIRQSLIKRLQEIHLEKRKNQLIQLLNEIKAYRGTQKDGWIKVKNPRQLI